jgi:hypothetical protein
MSRDYDIGRGKPPKQSQFAKGRSGNPHGRPKGRAAPVPSGGTSVDELTLRLAATPMSVTVNGATKTMPLAETVQNRRWQAAANGNRIGAKEIIEELRRAEEAIHADREAKFLFWRDYSRRDPVPPLNWPIDPARSPTYPHPRDIYVDTLNHEIYFVGPLEPEEAAMFMVPVAFRDYVLARAELDRRSMSEDHPSASELLDSALRIHRRVTPGLGGPRQDEAPELTLHTLAGRIMDLRSLTNTQLRAEATRFKAIFDQGARHHKLALCDMAVLGTISTSGGLGSRARTASMARKA